MRKLKSFVAAISMLFAATAHASSDPGRPPAYPESVASASQQQGSGSCWKSAAAFHGVDVWLLYAIALVESGFNPKAINKNTNGSVDIGLMQINSIWHKELAKYGIPAAALYDPCASVYIGAWILAKNIRKYGYTWKAIGAYNSANPSKSLKYAQKVYAAHRRLTGIPTNFIFPPSIIASSQ